VTGPPVSGSVFHCEDPPKRGLFHNFGAGAGCTVTRWLGEVDSNLRMAESMPSPQGMLPKKVVAVDAGKAELSDSLSSSLGAHTHGYLYYQAIPELGQ
jgi:hypothetical protein